jgi:hypothetical protein
MAVHGIKPKKGNSTRCESAAWRLWSVRLECRPSWVLAWQGSTGFLRASVATNMTREFFEFRMR